MTVNVLLEFEAWSVCETDMDTNDGKMVVYADHYRNCNNKENMLEKDIPYWSWEHTDGVSTLSGVEACWRCDTPCPAEVVAIVRLHNWGTPEQRPV